MTTFDPTKPVQTRDGRKARILCIDRQSPDYPIIALIASDRGEEVESYTAAGREYKTGFETDSDLFNVPVSRVQFCNQMEDGSLGSFTDYVPAAPRARAGQRRVAILRVETQLEPPQPPVFTLHQAITDDEDDAANLV